MLVLIHVSIALSSLAITGYTYLSPSALKLKLSYGLVVLTLISGTYLVVATHSPMLKACMAGLVYLGFCLSAIISAHHKLAKAALPKGDLTID